MYYCHTRSGSTRELFLPILAIAVLEAGCVTRPVDFGPGLVKFDARQYGEALLVFQEIADKDGGEANRARFYMGECYKYQSRYDRAIEQFQMVVDAEPSKSYLANQARDRISQIREGRKDIERLGVLFCSSELGDEKVKDALMLMLLLTRSLSCSRPSNSSYGSMERTKIRMVFLVTWNLWKGLLTLIPMNILSEYVW